MGDSKYTIKYNTFTVATGELETCWRIDKLDKYVARQVSCLHSKIKQQQAEIERLREIVDLCRAEWDDAGDAAYLPAAVIELFEEK